MHEHNRWSCILSAIVYKHASFLKILLIIHNFQQGLSHTKMPAMSDEHSKVVREIGFIKTYVSFLQL